MNKFNETEWLEFRAKYPELRFWQALRAYMEVGYIFLGERDREMPERDTLQDTFYIEDK
jgi:hypothetical protein